jgi:D-alanine-D-alanine ligase
VSRVVVAVLGGGLSPERSISLRTAREVRSHLPAGEFEAIFVEVLPDRRFAVEGGAAVSAGRALLEFERRGVQVVFPGLHGRFGEDGVVQGFLEVAGLPFVGSGVAASALAMDKGRTRDVLSRAGLPMPRAMEIEGTDGPGAMKRVLAAFGLPVVVKDPTGGSSLDLYIPRTETDLLAALHGLLRRPGSRVLVEEYVPGREITCAVLGNASIGAELEAWPPVLIRPLKSDWFDYKTKYDASAVQEICPAPVEPGALATVMERSKAAHRALRCDGLTRTDFILSGGGDPLFLEINTLPGLTAESICPKAATAAGVSFPELLARLVNMALECAAVRAAREVS